MEKAIKGGFSGKLKSISIDFTYNILSSLILTGVSQVIVYPVLAASHFDTEYGVILTEMGIVNTLIVAFGNTLNNVRLIMAAEYESKKVVGDFNLLCLAMSLMVFFCTIIISTFFFSISSHIVIGLAMFAVFGTLKSYYCVFFRLSLNFKKILVQHIVGSVGYLVGVGLLLIVPYWVLPFIFSEFFQLAFILKYSKLYKEPLKTTVLLKPTTTKYLILIVTGFSSTIITYLDRLVIYPLLGAGAVSTYTVASYFGKSLGLLMTPVAGVLLGYYAQKGFKMSSKLFWTINGSTIVIGAVFMIFSSIVAPLVTKFLYPSLYVDAQSYIRVANTAATINVLCSLTQVAVLKFAPTWIQIVKELAYGIVYVLCGYFLLNTYGLMGFCVAAITANIIKLLVLYLIGSLYISKNK